MLIGEGGRDTIFIMLQPDTSLSSASTTEPSDPYAVTPEVAPEPSSSEQEVGPSDSDHEENDRIVVHLDGDAYNELTKPDPHWATMISPKNVCGERFDSDYVYLDKERYFRMLAGINRGEQNGPTYEHSELRTYRLRKHLVEIIGRRLNMTEQQISRAVARATNVDGEKFGQRLILCVFCTCAYVVHRDETGYAKDRNYHPNKDEKDLLFQKVAFEFDLSPNRIENVCRKFDQTFTDMVPPVRYDRRKPNWKPNEHPDKEIVASRPTEDERRGLRLRGGI